MRKILLTSLVAAATASAFSQTYLTGSLTASDPIFNRPVTLTGLSGVGTAVSYDAYAFTVSTSGTYVIEMASTQLPPTGTGIDTFLHLYTGAFNPAAALSNLTALNDDFTGPFTVLPGPYSAFVGASGTGSLANGANPASRLSVVLVSGQAYNLVATSFDNAEVGTYYIGANGPGSVNVVPEPASMAALGLGALALLRKKRKNS